MSRKGLTRAARGYNEMDHMGKKVCSASYFKEYVDYSVFQLQT